MTSVGNKIISSIVSSIKFREIREKAYNNTLFFLCFINRKSIHKDKTNWSSSKAKSGVSIVYIWLYHVNLLYISYENSIEHI